MGLIGETTPEKIWNFLKSKGLSSCGAAGLMGNLYAESGLNPQNLQNSYEKKLGHTDASYTAAVDNGSYGNFARDGAGYGLAQWTYHTRKAALLEYAKAAGKSTFILIPAISASALPASLSISVHVGLLNINVSDIIAEHIKSAILGSILTPASKYILYIMVAVHPTGLL